MSILFIVALVIFLVGLILLVLPHSQYSRIGTVLALVGLALVVFLPTLVRL